MNIAVFADVHGRILLCFKLCARWEQETGDKIALILQAGDLGAFPDETRLDKATIKFAQKDPTELGFLHNFAQHQLEVAALLEQTTCNLIFVRGNHEDHAWLDTLERRAEAPIFPVDAYQRLYCLKTGVPYTFRQADEALTVLGIGRIAPPAGTSARKPQHIQPHELKRLDQLGACTPDILLTHDSTKDAIIPGAGLEEIGLLLDRCQPSYHFFGHYGGPCLQGTDANGKTHFCKLADLAWNQRSRGQVLEPGAMGLLRWKNAAEHRFEIVNQPWLKEYTAFSWRYL